METPRPEHPRPDRVRMDWLNLNGVWQFEFDPGRSGVARGLPAADGLDGEIVVPFCPESQLSGIGDVDFHAGVWYRRTVRIPTEWDGQRVLLHVGASDHDTTVWVNGRQAGFHRGGFTPFAMDVTGLLRAGENAFVINAEDDTRSPMVAGGKQCPDYHSRGCHYTRTTGIWQTVWLEAVPQTYLANVRLTPLLETGQVIVEGTVAGGAWMGSLQARATLDGRPVGTAEVPFVGQRAMAIVDLEAVEPWAPGSPTLYDLELTLTAPDGSVDKVTTYFGLRSLGMTDRALLFNGMPLFQRLVLDQGFYPTGIYTAPTDDDLKNDVLLSQAMGFNGARLHQKVFEPRFLYWADRLGYLVWGEFPSWGLDVSDPRALEVFAPQWLEAMARDVSHPALVGWCPLNETQRDQDPEVNRSIYRMSKAFDPTRPVIDTSGYQHVETDVYDIHNYEQDVTQFVQAFAPFAEGGEPFRNHTDVNAPYGGEPYFVSEYGGIWWNPGQIDAAGWGYGGVSGRPRSEDEFFARYRGMTEALLRHPRVCALCYTQLYDVEQEVNGLYFYDRTEKFDPEIIKAINEQKAAIED